MTGDEQARSFGGFFQFVKYQHMCTLGILQVWMICFFGQTSRNWRQPANHLKPADEKVKLPPSRSGRRILTQKPTPMTLPGEIYDWVGNQREMIECYQKIIFLKINSTPGRDILLCQTAQLLRCQLGSILFDIHHSSILSIIYLRNTSSVSFYIIIKSNRSYLRCADCERLQASERKDSK